MAYYDHLVENPEAALDETAYRRGDSREVMATRLEVIRGMSIGLGHLTLSQAQSLIDENAPLNQELVAHIEQCGYCTALLYGLEAPQ